MEKSTSNRTIIRLLIAAVVALGLASFVLCLLAEYNKSEVNGVKFDGRRCSLPRSDAFRFGIAALICLCAAQILGNSIVCGLICAAVRAGFGRKAACSGVLLAFSWISCGMAAILIGVASSMNRRQPYGKGWLDGNCYVVKDGVFGGAGALVLVTAGCIVGTAGFAMRPLDGVRKSTKRPPSLQGEN